VFDRPSGPIHSDIPVTNTYVPETEAALQLLGGALVAQLDPPNSEEWSDLEFSAYRVEKTGPEEVHRLKLEVTGPSGSFPLIPRPEAWEACLELDRLATLGGRPRWRGFTMHLKRQSGEISYESAWQYDEP